MLDRIKASVSQLPLDKFKIAYFITGNEADVLYSNAKGFPLAFECGTAHGFSASVLAAAGARVYTFDIVNRTKVWDHADYGDLHKQITCHVQPFVEGIKPLLERFANRTENAIFFIDGDHGRASVIGEWNTIKSFLKPGDRVLFHDLNLKDIRRVWHRLS